jgi:hypothetical protein
VTVDTAAEMKAWLDRTYGPSEHKPKPRDKGYVYFMQAVDGGPIKIGWAKDPEKRLAAHQVSSASELKLLGAMWGTQDVERKWHARFAHLRIRGEWFEGTEALLRAIDRAPA